MPISYHWAFCVANIVCWACALQLILLTGTFGQEGSLPPVESDKISGVPAVDSLINGTQATSSKDVNSGDAKDVLSDFVIPLQDQNHAGSYDGTGKADDTTETLVASSSTEEVVHQSATADVTATVKPLPSDGTIASLAQQPNAFESPRRNYASKECGAKVLFANDEAENRNAVLNDKERDDYMRNPCERAQNKFLIIELCENIQPQTLEIANFELFSSNPRHIRMSVSERYPALEWSVAGEFEAQDTREVQFFQISTNGAYAKFIKLELLSHHGKEHYCTLSSVRLYGISIVDEYEAEAAVAESANNNNINNVPLLISPYEEQQQQQPSDSQQEQIVREEAENVARLRHYVNALLPSARFANCYQSPITAYRQNTSFWFCHLFIPHYQHLTHTRRRTSSTTSPELYVGLGGELKIEPAKAFEGVEERKLLVNEDDNGGEVCSAEESAFNVSNNKNNVSVLMSTSAVGSSPELPILATNTSAAKVAAGGGTTEKRKKIIAESPIPTVIPLSGREVKGGKKEVEHSVNGDQKVPSMVPTPTPPILQQQQQHQPSAIPLMPTIASTTGTVLSNGGGVNVNGNQQQQQTPPPPTQPSVAQQQQQPQYNQQQQPAAKFTNGNNQNPLPGSSTSHKESVFIKLNKRIAALEMNVSASNEHLAEMTRRNQAQFEELIKYHERMLQSTMSRNARLIQSMQNDIGLLKQEMSTLRHHAAEMEHDREVLMRQTRKIRLENRCLKQELRNVKEELRHSSSGGTCQMDQSLLIPTKMRSMSNSNSLSVSDRGGALSLYSPFT